MTHLYVPATIGAEVAHLLGKALQDHPPPLTKSLISTPNGKTSRRIGSYLLDLGYVTPWQLVPVLAEQRQSSQESKTPKIGDILVQKGLVNSQVLVAVLLVQMIDRLFDHSYRTNRFLGEDLIARGVLSPTQLAPALELQTWLRQRNLQVRLGDLLIRQGVVDQQMLRIVLQTNMSTEVPVVQPANL